MRQLNFRLDLAEELCMKRVGQFFDGFMVLVLVIIAALGSVQYYVATSKTYIENNPELTAQIERQKELAVLKAELEKIQAAQQIKPSREIASVSAPPIMDQAEQHFAKLKMECDQKDVSPVCLDQIDLMISQYPETLWAAESMVVLADIYTKTNESRRAVDLLKVLRARFAGYPTVQAKVNYIEKRL